MKELLIFVAGNPSIPGIYEWFLDEFQEENREILVLNHYGQCFESNYKKRKVSVDQVIEIHRKKINNKLNQNNYSKVIIIAHSLGAMMVSQFYSEFTHKISKVILVCPFFGPTKNNIKPLILLQNPLINKFLYYTAFNLFRFKKIREFVFDKKLKLGEKSNIIKAYVSQKTYLHNLLSLLSNYISYFEKVNINTSLAKLDYQKVCYVFAQKDYWAPIEWASKLNPKSKILYSDFSHDFCLNKKEAELVASFCKDLFSTKEESPYLQNFL